MIAALPARMARFILALVLLSSFLFYTSTAKVVNLRTGQTVLRRVPSSGVVSTKVAKSSSTDSVAGVAAYATKQSWGEGLLLREYIISYNDDDHAKAIKQALESQGAKVLSYIPPNNLRVVAEPTVALGVAASQNTELAELGAKDKVDPDWTPVLDAITASKDAAAAASQPGADEAAQIAAYIAELRVTKALRNVRTSTAASGVVQYGMEVQLLPGLPADAPKAALKDWPDLIPGVSSATCRPNISATTGTQQQSAPRLWIFMCKEDLAAGIAWLAAQPVVSWIARLPVIKLYDAYANILMQTGSISMDGLVQELNRTNYPYWKAGLYGQGEILGLSDTGLDVENCNFRDPRFVGNYSALLAKRDALPKLGELLSYAAIPQHRKVVQYAMSFAGDSMDLGGHGTLCASTAAGAILANTGKPLGDFKLMNTTGAAPGARLSLVDIEHYGIADGSSVWPPNAVEHDLLPAHKFAGAKILSDSWGGEAPYSAQAVGYDKFLWENPDMVSFVSAGNSGLDELADTTVSMPSIAKNVISVGAGYYYPELPVENAVDWSTIYSFKIVPAGETTDDNAMSGPLWGLNSPNGPSIRRVIMPVFGGQGTPVNLTLASPVDACKPLRNPADQVNGTGLLVLYRAACGTDTVVRNAEALGAKLIVLVWPATATSNDVYMGKPPARFMDNGTLVNGSMPIFGIATDLGLQLVASLGAGDHVTLNGTYVALTDKVIPRWSSWGPTLDGRVKPDIIAPGARIISTYSSLSEFATKKDPKCGTSTLWDGTSAACPLAAGTMALARQYLRLGFYPTGSPKDSDSSPFTPSGMLIKALAIAGAVDMQGGTAEAHGATPLGPSPDGYQGWGRLNLAGALPLKGVTDSDVMLQLADWGSFTKKGQSTTLRGLKATGTGSVTIVLTWYDYPADPNAFPSLVNDLNLVVKLNGTDYLGNQIVDENGDAQPDDRNTVERVVLEQPAANTPIVITVSAYQLGFKALNTTAPQRWAVAVVGAIKGTIKSSLNPAWAKAKTKY